jgi:hypothetical protein
MDVLQTAGSLALSLDFLNAEAQSRKAARQVNRQNNFDELILALANFLGKGMV